MTGHTCGAVTTHVRGSTLHSEAYALHCLTDGFGGCGSVYNCLSISKIHFHGCHSGHSLDGLLHIGAAVVAAHAGDVQSECFVRVGVTVASLVVTVAVVVSASSLMEVAEP